MSGFLCFFLFQFYNLTLLNTEKVNMDGKAAVVPLQDTKVIAERSSPRITYFHLVSADGFMALVSCRYSAALMPNKLLSCNWL